MLAMFVLIVKTTPAHGDDGDKQMCVAGDLLESGFMKQGQLSRAREASRRLLKDLRPDAVALVEAFGMVSQTLCNHRFVKPRPYTLIIQATRFLYPDLSDLSLASTIGARDGQAYKRLWASQEAGASAGPCHGDDTYEECIFPLSRL